LRLETRRTAPVCGCPGNLRPAAPMVFSPAVLRPVRPNGTAAAEKRGTSTSFTHIISTFMK
jgi:hypothetical protein